MPRKGHILGAGLRGFSTYGQLRANVDTMIDARVLGPREVRFTDLAGQPQTLLLTAELVAGGLYELLSFHELLPVLPAALKEASDGTYELLATIGFAYLGGDFERSDGMRLSVLCAEEIAHSSRARFRAAARGTDRIVSAFFMLAQVRGFFDACEAWPVPPATPLLELPVIARTPTLLVSGRFDPKTPPPYAQSIARFLHGEQLVEVPYASHSGHLLCEAALLTSFFADASAPVDVGCAERPLGFAYREQRAPPPVAARTRCRSIRLVRGSERVVRGLAAHEPPGSPASSAAAQRDQAPSKKRSRMR